jgi:hypothetical protein
MLWNDQRSQTRESATICRLSAESRRLHGCDVSGGTRHVGETGHSCQVVGVLDLWVQLIRRKSYRGFNQ